MEKDILEKEGRDKKRYELSFLTTTEEASRDILRLVNQHGIEVKTESQPKKINLAYKIKQATSAYFGFFILMSLPEDAKSLEHDIKTVPAVLRSLIITLPTKRDSEARAAAKENYKAATTAKRPTYASAPAIKHPQVLSNEALEKKIEEILK